MSGRAFKYLTQPMCREFNLGGEQNCGHPERSEAESKDPAKVPRGFATEFFDFPRNDTKMLSARKLGRRRRRVCLIQPRRNMPVMTVALDRLAASFANGVFKRGDSLLLRRGGA